MNIILDTEPLLLLSIGLFNPNYLDKINFGNRQLQKIDFDLFYSEINNNKLIVTPNILTEVCNIAENKLGSNLFEEYMQKINHFLKEGVIEIYNKKENLLEISMINKFGFSDTSIFLICKSNDDLLITNDFPLFNLCIKNGKKAKYLKAELENKRSELPEVKIHK